MTREEAIKEMREKLPWLTEDTKRLVEFLIPELSESEDDALEFLKGHAIEWIASIEHDISQSVYDGIKGHSPEDERELAEWKKALAWLEKQKEPKDKGEISDGYHTFNELYFYRMLYNAAFFNLLPKEWVHKSKKHHDGEECFGGGWFIVMANLPTGQISNHYELKDWDLFQIPEKEVADEWDGHTPQEAAERLHKYLLEKQKEQKHPNGCFTCDEYKKGYEEGRRNGFTAGYNKAMKEQKPAEWNEEDERRIQRICDFLWKNRKGDTDTIYQIEKDADWLKSLRPSWKPSEDQLEALEYVCRVYSSGGAEKSLYNNLKKLCEQLQELV